MTQSTRGGRATAARPAGADPSDETAAVLTASRALLGVVARSLAPALEQVSMPQFRVLVVLSTSGGAMRSVDLANTMGIHPSTFSRNADRLVAGGWVRRVEHPDSRREILVELTDEGGRLVALVTRRRRAEITRVLRNMDPEQREQVRAGLELFADAAGEPSVDDLAALGM